MNNAQIIHADCLDWLMSQPDNSVDLVFTSPPYEDARTYSMGFKLRGQAFVDWLVERVVECVRVSRGLVAFVIEGKTRNFAYSATPILLMADLHRRGITLRKPPAFKRVGIPGSGGPDWLRNDYEFIVCCTSGGKLPWSHNTAMGHPPKWAPGGAMSNRLADGGRRDQWGGTGHASSGEGRKKNGDFKGKNQWGHSIASGATVVDAEGVVRSRGKRPSHVRADKLHTKTLPDGSRELQGYSVPVLANPGNVIECVVGGGVMGSKLAHENEAPFPESLAEFFIRSFCPPGGIVLDPFCGSGTTLKVALKHGRKAIGIDCRESQVELTKRRIMEVQL